MTDNWPNLDLSIVSTLYRSEACLDEFCRRVVQGGGDAAHTLARCGLRVLVASPSAADVKQGAVL